MNDCRWAASAGPSTEEGEANLDSLSGGWQVVPVHYQDSNDTFSLKPTLPENEKDPFAWSILQVTEIYKYTGRGNLAYNKKKTTGSAMK